MANLMSELSGLSGKRIVFCERDGVQQLHLRRTFQMAGLVVVGVATTAGDTHSLVVRERPDIVLLDTSLSDGNASEVARAILEACPLCLVLITTDPNLEARAAELGVTRCLVKPFDAETLLSSLQEALTKRPPS